MSDAFRVYSEVGKDGYPPEWHTELKHIVREDAGHRCVRCKHPYTVRQVSTNVTATPGFQVQVGGKWENVSRCDEQCRHRGPVLVPATEGGWIPVACAEDDEVAAMVADGVEVLGVWRVLTVHHLNGDKADCRWWNLAALCQRCHLTIQGRVVMARVWPWEHTEWFRPYVAGYYASAYLGEELTREQVAERLDELLALERAA